MNNLYVWMLSFWVPRQRWYRRHYLRSRHWRSFREKVGTKRGWTCEEYGCTESGRHLDLHHLNYRLWFERPSDVKLLCREHHEMEHGK